MPSPRIPDSPREAPSTVQFDSLPFRSVRWAASPPGPRSRPIVMPEAVPISTPARPGTLWPSSGTSVKTTSWRRACALPCCSPLPCISEPISQPSREASQPQKSTPAIAESDRWRTVTLSIRPSSSRHCGGSKVEATRSRQGVPRSQARSTT